MFKLNKTINVLGLKLRIDVIILLMIVGFILSSSTTCGCLTKEAYANIDYLMNKGVHNTKYEEKVNMIEVNELAGTSLRPVVPLREGELFMWSNNVFDDKCCATSNVSGPAGCACITKEQTDFLKSRGGNRDISDTNQF
jgi:hypothetical protein